MGSHKMIHRHGETMIDSIATIIQIGHLNGDSSRATAEKIVEFMDGITIETFKRDIALEAGAERE